MKEIDFEIGRYYNLKYVYKGRTFETFSCYIGFNFGNHYFKDDAGGWLLLIPKNITQANKSESVRVVVNPIKPNSTTLHSKP